MTPGTDPLAALRPYHLPEPVGWWPPAPGWWLLAGLVLLLLLTMLRLAWLGWRRAAPRRAALRELQQLARSRPDHRCLGRLNRLLRRYLLARLARPELGGLTGEAWLACLDRICAARPRSRCGFRHGPGRHLLSLPYQADGRIPQRDHQALIQLCRRVIMAPLPRLAQALKEPPR